MKNDRWLEHMCLDPEKSREVLINLRALRGDKLTQMMLETEHYLVSEALRTSRFLQRYVAARFERVVDGSMEGLKFRPIHLRDRLRLLWMLVWDAWR